MRTARTFLRVFVFTSVFALGCACTADAEVEGLKLTLDAQTESMRAGLEEAIAPLAGEAASDLQATRDANDATRRITDYLNSEGYFDPAIETVTADAAPIGIELSVSVGRLFKIGQVAVSIDGNDAAATALSKAVTLKTGDAVRPASVIAEEVRLVRDLQMQGYAFARALERVAEGDRDAATIDLTLRFDAGSRVELGDVKFPEGLQQPEKFLDRLVPFSEGDPYAPEALAELNANLAETGLYRIASASLEREGVAQADGSTRHVVTVTAIERAPHTVSLGGSFASSEGLGLTGEWIYRNAVGRGDTLTSSAVIAPQQRTLDAQWRFPNAAGKNRSLIFGAAGGREETDGYDRDFFALDAGLERRRDDRNRLRYGASLELTRETPIGTARALTDLYDLMIASLSASVVRDRTDNLLDPSQGWRAEARLEPGIVFGDASANYVHTLGQASTYRAFGPSEQFVGALRARVGVTSGAGAVELPTSRRFYAGGGGSVRGYAFQEIGPADADGRPLGGRSLSELSAEVRWRREGRWDGAAFIDAGAVSTRDVPDFSGMKAGAGFGVIYNTPAGPLRADLAWPLQDGAEMDDVKVYVSLGQAF